MAMGERQRFIFTVIAVGLVSIAAGLSLANGWLPSRAAQEKYGEKTWADTTLRRVIHTHDGLPEHEHVITVVVATTEGTPHGDFHNFAATLATGVTQTPAAAAPEQGITPTAAAPVPAQGVNEVVVQSREFRPSNLTVAVGATVTWTNKDSDMHTITSDTGLFNGSLAPLASFNFTFTTPGVFPYHCETWSSMAGTITVK
ncbi:MAG: cupredoxin domain-containing protein [Dehalococcoidales bacterium]|nr:cupredoxin domain-containing protein [Dehalococcoidales bacterium]